MLILSRKINESVVIDGTITVKILRIDGDQVRIGIQAPSDVPVHRQEVYDEIQRSNREAATQVRPNLPRLSPKPQPKSPNTIREPLPLAQGMAVEATPVTQP